MSTKIYEAYKLNENISMTSLMGMLRDVRNDYLNKCAEFIKRTKKDLSPDKIFKELRSKGDCERWEFGASIMIYFFEGQTYIQFFGLDFTEGKGLDRLMKLLTDYHYQNQADEWWCYEDGHSDEDIKRFEKDWAERERVWEGIYSESSRPNECGLVFEVYTQNDDYKIVRKAFDLEG